MAISEANSQTNTARPLNVLIAGAGIGGLAAAVGLRQQGHHVTIFERSRLAEEVGAAMHIAPNCTGVLRHMGIDPAQHGAVEMYGTNTYGADGTIWVSRDSQEDNKKYPHKWLLMHRAHVHAALKAKALGTDGPGRPAVLSTRAEVVTADPKRATITTSDGEVHQGDLVIGADGVHSKTRKLIPGGDLKPFDSGKSAFRFLVPMEHVIADEQARKLLQYNQYFHIWIGRDRRIVMYPCASNTQMNVVVIFPSELAAGDGGGDQWSRPARKEDMLAMFEGFDPLARAVLNMAGADLKMWTLLDLEKMPQFRHEKLALIGDAAHPFLPHQAQGGAQAIEDGCSIAAVLPLGTTPDQIPGRLQLYEKQRYERAHNIQEFTRLTGEDLVDGKPFPDFRKFTDYNVNHDEWLASTAALKGYLGSPVEV